MTIEKMVYSRKEIFNAMDAINKFPLTTRKKIEHMCKLEEARILFDNVLHSINRALFDSGCSPYFLEYKESVLIHYKNLSKSDLDKKLRLLMYNSYNILVAIIKDGESGDVIISE